MASSTPRISGHCDPRFSRVRDEFERNLDERGEVGASVCVTLEGETVVDLWAGSAAPDGSRPWEKDTISIVWSSTKGAAALCAHVLASRGQLDLDAPVSRYWPEFKGAGKETIPVRMLLNHQSGLSAIRKPVPAGAFAEQETMARLLAEETPFWTPGTRHGYGAITFGWLVAEVVRRVAGRTLGRFFREEVAEPLGLDFWIGLPEEHEPRVATMTPPPPSLDAPFFRAVVSEPTSVQALVYNDGGFTQGFDQRAARACELPSANGVTNARGLAGLYAPLACGGALRGVKLVDRASLARMIAVSSAAGQDAVLLLPSRFSLGYMKSIDNRRQPPGTQESMLLGEQAFGHAGFGGSIGFADPAEKLSMGYTMNRMGEGVLLNPRGQGLVDAVYLSLGYTSNEPGVWIR